MWSVIPITEGESFECSLFPLSQRRGLGNKECHIEFGFCQEVGVGSSQDSKIV